MKNDYNFWIERGLIAGFELLEQDVKSAFRTSEDKEGYLPVRLVFLSNGVKGFNGDGYAMPVLFDEKYTKIPRDKVYPNLSYTFYIDNFGVREIGYSRDERVEGGYVKGDIVRFKDTDKFNLGEINDTLRGYLIKVYGQEYGKVIVPHLAQNSEDSKNYCSERERSITKNLIKFHYGNGLGNVLTDVLEDKTNDNK